MAYYVSTTVWQTIILAYLLCFLQVLTEMRTLQHYCTATSGIKGFPAYIQTDTVDDKVVSHYDSTTQRKVPAQCMKGHLDQQFWNWSIKETREKQKHVTTVLERTERLKNQTGGEHVLQWIQICQWDNKTRTPGESYEQPAYDGENFTLADRKGITCMHFLDDHSSIIKSNCPVQVCIDLLTNFVQYGKECLKKVPPEVSLFQNSSSVVCHATGFYPKAVNITWKRDGEEIKVYLGETLPNGDGTFQKRAVLRLSPEERSKGTYTCEVEHKTGEPIIKTLMEGKSHWFSIVIAIGIAIAILIGIGIAIVLHKQQDQEASSRCLELSNRNERSSIGSAEPMMARANIVPTYC